MFDLSFIYALRWFYELSEIEALQVSWQLPLHSLHLFGIQLNLKTVISLSD